MSDARVDYIRWEAGGVLDPNALFAALSHYADFSADPGTGGPPPVRFPILFETGQACSVADARALGLDIPSVYPDATRFATAVLDPSQYGRLTRGDWNDCISRWELQLPVIPLRAGSQQSLHDLVHPSGWAYRAGGQASRGEGTDEAREVIGVIDTGCPFAHQDYLRQGRTRLRALWHQGGAPALEGIAGHVQPTDLGYGTEVLRPAIDDYLQSCRSAQGAIDEERCYRGAHYPQLNAGFAHGAAVLHLFASPRPRESRYPRETGGTLQPPTWSASDDKAGRADIVFVQLPQSVVEDSTSAALARHVLDGLRYIVERAGRGPRRIVVNLSDGTSRSLHDGSSILECAMRALVREVAMSGQGRSLDIVIAAGNAFREARHAVLDAAGDSAWLRVLPDCERPVFLNVRLPVAEQGKAPSIFITPPKQTGAAEFEVRPGQIAVWSHRRGASLWVVLPPVSAAPTQALVVWSPTAVTHGQRAAAPVGDWRVRTAGGASQAQVHLWTSLNQKNTVSPSTARQARFIDADGRYDPRRYLREAQDDANPPTSVIRRRMSLSGLSTSPENEGVWIVGASLVRPFRVGDDPRSPYSSVGPSLGARRKVDGEMPADFAWTQPGIRAGGTRSGWVDSVSGTSFSAPQWARALLDR